MQTKTQISLHIHSVWLHYQNSIESIGAISKMSRLYLPSVAKQASFSLTWSQTSKNRFLCRVCLGYTSLKTGFLMTWLIYYLYCLTSATLEDFLAPLICTCLWLNKDYPLTTISVTYPSLLNNRSAINPLSCYCECRVLVSLNSVKSLLMWWCHWRCNRKMSQLMRLWYLSNRRPAKAQTSLRISAVSPEPSLFTHMKYGRVWHLAPLDGCTCAFEEWIYRGRKVP